MHTKILSIVFEVQHTLLMFECSHAENTWSHFRKEACPRWCCHTNLWEETALGTVALPEKKEGRWMKSEFKYAEMIWPNLCAARRGARTNRSLKCENRRHKWTVLICRAECCARAEMTHCEILFVTLCSLLHLNQRLLTALRRPHSSSRPRSSSSFPTSSVPNGAPKRDRQRLGGRLQVLMKSARFHPAVSRDLHRAAKC